MKKTTLLLSLLLIAVAISAQRISSLTIDGKTSCVPFAALNPTNNSETVLGDGQIIYPDGTDFSNVNVSLNVGTDSNVESPVPLPTDWSSTVSGIKVTKNDLSSWAKYNITLKKIKAAALPLEIKTGSGFFDSNSWTTSTVGWAGACIDKSQTLIRFGSAKRSFMVAFNSAPDSLIYTIKYLSSPWSTSNVFDVDGSVDGISWTSIVQYNANNAMPLTSPAVITRLKISSEYRYIRWIYTTRVATANVSLENIKVTNNITVESGEKLTINENKTYSSITVAPGGKLELADGKTLTARVKLLSNVNGTGTFVDKNSGLNPPSITGTVEQYLPQGRNWYVGIPVSETNLPYSNLTSAGATSISYYSEKNGWVNNHTGELTPGVGYVAVSGSGNATNNVSFTGTLNNGNVDILLTRKGSTKAGFNLIANPYPSYLNAMTAINNNVNIEKTIWYRTKGADYQFETVNTTSGKGTNNANTGAVTGYIPPMQAFWVRATADDQTLSFSNAMRTHANPEVEGSTTATTPMKAPTISTTLLRLRVSNGTNSDEAILMFHPNALDVLDNYDSHKWMNNVNEIPEIYTIAGEEILVINGMKNIPMNVEIPLGFSTKTNNSFSLKASELNNMDADIKVLLIDKQNILSPEFDLSSGEVYSFGSDITNSKDRFSIIFKASTVISGIENINSVEFSVYTNAKGQITVVTPQVKASHVVEVFNSAGQRVMSQSVTNNHTLLNKTFRSGVYVVKINEVLHKVIVK